jgi:7-carboxy-7-deazaguanine synthase
MKLARLPDGSPEIFHTLQGEGASLGKPSVFIRSSLCNLHCQWCDTDYTWNWEGTPWTHERDGEEGYQKYRKEEQITELSPEDIARAVSAFPCRHLVLTGGEPLLQQDDFAAVLAFLQDSDPTWTAEVETNGTLIPSPALDARISNYNVSPKLANSGNKESLRRVPEALAWFAASPKTWFKFVVAEEGDLTEILALQALLSLPADRLFLMPEGRSEGALAQRRLWLADLCRDHGFRYTDRLHLSLWGPGRGR